MGPRVSLAEGEFGGKYLPNEYYSAGCVSRVLRTLADNLRPEVVLGGPVLSNHERLVSIRQARDSPAQEQKAKVDTNLRVC